MFSNREPVSIVIPAFNEENAISAQIDKIRGVLTGHKIDHEIIVVDDGCQDRTAEIAGNLHVRVIKHFKNRGYGAALKTGISVAKYDTIGTIDADGTYPAEEIPNLLDKLSQADMVVGARTGKEVHIPLVRRPAKWVLRLLAARIAGQKIPDLNSGLRAFRRDFVKQYFSILPNGFSFTTNITLAMLADDYRVVYHSIDYYKRIGKSKITPRNFMDFMVLIIRMAMLFKPLKIFLPLALFFGFLGAGKTIFDLILLYRRVSDAGHSTLFSQSIISTSSILLLLVSLQLLLIGMVTDALLTRMNKPNYGLLPTHGISSEEKESRPGVDKPDTITTHRIGK